MELNVECLETLTKETAIALEKAMVDAGKIWCKEVPLKADAVISNHWTH